MQKASGLERARKTLSKWIRRANGKTFFANFLRHPDGKESLTVGYGHDAASMAGSSGVPVGMAFTTLSAEGSGRERSYLILCFNNDWQGPELAEYLGGVSKRFRGPRGDNDEDMMMAPFAVGALERARDSWRTRNSEG